jgi:hypothetical protein
MNTAGLRHLILFHICGLYQGGPVALLLCHAAFPSLKWS